MQFVNITADNQGKDADTRRKVRTEAMKHFRQQQRESRQQVCSDKGTPRSARPKSRLVAVQPYYTVERYPNTSTCANVPVHGLPARPVQTSADRHSVALIPSSTTSDDQVHVDSCQLSQLDDVVQTDQSRSSSELIRTPSVWYSDTLDPFTSPAQVTRLLAIFDAYIRWKLPPAAQELGALNLKTYEGCLAKPSLCATVLCAISLLENDPGRPFLAEADLWKVHTLRALNKDLANPRVSTSDETIRRVCCLLLHELCRGNVLTAETHLRGLKRMVELRGGLQHLGLGGTLTAAMWFIDVSYAAAFDKEQVFLQLESPVASPATSDCARITYAPFSCPLVPLDSSRTHDQDVLLEGSVADRVLQCAWEATRNCFAFKPVYQMSAFQHRILNTPTEKTSPSFKTAEVCRFAARIHCLAVAREPCRYDDPVNEEDAQGIYELISQVDVREMILAVSHHLYIWM